MPDTVHTQSKYPAIGLLITDDLERDRPEADVVSQAKIELPHAMQTKEREQGPGARKAETISLSRQRATVNIGRGPRAPPPD